MVSSSLAQAHLYALPISPEMPGTFNCAAVKMVSLTSLLVMLTYSMLSGLWFRLGVGSFSRCGGSGKRCFQRVSHFSEWVTAGVEFSPQSRGGEI